MALFQIDAEPVTRRYRPDLLLPVLLIARLRAAVTRPALSPRQHREAELRREAARRVVDALLR